MPDARSQGLSVQLDLVSGAARVYPGELLELFARVRGAAAQRGLRLTVTMPARTEWAGTAASDADTGRPLAMTPLVEATEEGVQLTWELTDPGVWPGSGELRVTTRVLPLSVDTPLESSARVTNVDGEMLASALCRVAARASGDYLKYLPEIYQVDELMGRFLMLFESFWAPLDLQIDNLGCIFDPDLTLAEFLPWLGSWVDVTLDGRLPETRRRRLIQAAVPLYRSRGTKDGLRRYLEAYTGGDVRIVEYRAHNLELGAGAQLGAGIALGLKNEPHTFKVEISLPPVDAEDPQDREKQETERRRRIAGIIESEKPAHTAYDLRLESYER